jgi:hypothetical protein
LQKIWTMLAAACFAAGLGACMGRTPQPVAVIQPQDQFMDCTAIYAETQANNAKIQQLAKDNGWKVAQNVAAGVAGFVVPVLWFGMDFQGTADKEATALQARQQYLGAMAVQKRCGGPPQTANR